ncbi:hypothetical protein BsWGS_21479 [Bradybaena similaris]
MMKTYIIIICLAGAASATYPDGNGVKRIAKASNNFSQRLHQQIASGPANQIYSPSSIHQALSMTSLGARGDTETEMRTVLGLNIFTRTRESHRAYRDVITLLNSAPDVTIRTANAIFVNQRRTVESTYITDVRNLYLAEASTFDVNDPAGPETVINDYVENKTKGLIKDLIPAGSIDPLTLAVVINTFYFNASWQTPFNKEDTKKAPFFPPQGTIQVDTMFSTRTMNIKRNFSGADVGELVLGTGRFSLFIAQPHSVNGLPALERSLTTPGKIEQIFEGLKPERVNMSLPKFNITSQYKLKENLQALGINKAFDQRQANFTGIDRAGGVFISDVIHQALIEVNEAGTVAAAATAITIGVVSLPPPPTATFYVVRQYLFFLRDNRLKLILFQGKYLG